jgi:hypothetical protein
MVPHLLRCQWLAVNDYGFALGRLESGAPSTFAQLGYKRKTGLCSLMAFLGLELPKIAWLANSGCFFLLGILLRSLFSGNRIRQSILKKNFKPTGFSKPQ